MSFFDFINGTFEALGGFFLLLNVRKLYRVKVVGGVDWRSTAFFTAWGCWNLAFYPSLGQWLSFAGGLFLVIVNFIWLCQIAFYTWRNA